MRRGLISWSRDEVPEAVLDARIAAVQTGLAEQNLAALVVCTTPARAAGVSWLAGFVPYWNQGLLVVPRNGRPILVSALSNRVADWLQLNAHVEAVRNSPRIGAEAAKFVASSAAHGAIGVVDLPHLPAPVIADLAAEGHRVADATELFRKLRWPVDACDLALHTRAAEIAYAAFATVGGTETDAAQVIARVDTHARNMRAEEVYPALAADLAKSRKLVRMEGTAALGDLWALRLSVAYKGAWVRVTRTFSRNDEKNQGIAETAAQYHECVGALPSLKWLAPPLPKWLIEGTRTTLPLEPLAGSMIADPQPIAPGSIVSAETLIVSAGYPILMGDPWLVGGNGHGETRRLVPASPLYRT